MPVRFYKRIIGFLLFTAVFAAAVYFVAVPVYTASVMPDGVRLTKEEIENRQSLSANQFVKTKYNADAAVDDEGYAWVDLKLFGIIPIKKIRVEVLPYEQVYAGGLPIGFSASTDGVIVLHDANGFKRGDVITEMGGEAITSVEDLEKHLNGKNLGLWVKDETSGVGMLTYINPDNNNYAALGHMLVDHETGASVNLRAGEAYACNVIGIEKCSGRRAGEFQSTLKKGSGGVQGSVLAGNAHGVFGCLDKDSGLLAECRDNVYSVASRYSVKPGKAGILTALDGRNIKEYEIEIIKTRYQKNKADKGIILRITDKELLDITGGIIHGMSGSPIIQNGKIVGALTHVMVGDYTKGYGMYIDFMLP